MRSPRPSCFIFAYCKWEDLGTRLVAWLHTEHVVLGWSCRSTVLIVPAICRGHMEKQEMEMKWKLETETGNWKLKWKHNLLAVLVIQMLLVFVPRHPSALAASSFCLPHRPQLCDCLVFLTWFIVYVLSSILSLMFHSWFCINMPCTCPESGVIVPKGLGMKP